MNLDEERKAFDEWHFLDWKLNCAVTDTIEYARNIYDRIYKPTNYDQIYVREQSFKAWQAAKAHEAKKLKGCVVVPVESIEAALLWMDEDIDAHHMSNDGFDKLFKHKPILEKILLEAARSQS